MNNFSYQRAADTASAFRLAGAGHAKYLGGGTNLIDLMRENIEQPDALIDVSGLSCDIEETADGGIVIGAGVKNTAVDSSSIAIDYGGSPRTYRHLSMIDRRRR